MHDPNTSPLIAQHEGEGHQQQEHTQAPAGETDHGTDHGGGHGGVNGIPATADYADGHQTASPPRHRS